jgi:hypothetical protein
MSSRSDPHFETLSEGSAEIARELEITLSVRVLTAVNKRCLADSRRSAQVPLSQGVDRLPHQLKNASKSTFPR